MFVSKNLPWKQPPDTFPVFKYMFIYIYIERPLSDFLYLEPSEKKSTDFVGAGSFFGVGQGKLLMMHFEKD